MGYYARLKHGSRYIDLAGDVYNLLPGFTPPQPSPNPLLTGGNMLNKYSGGRRVDRSFIDRPLNLPLKIMGDTASETHMAVRRICSFIETAMLDSAEPLYFVYGESDAIPYEPHFGQQFRYYEIKDATQAIGGLYGVAGVNEKIIRINLSMLVGPLTVGLRQRVGSATGGILEHTFATDDGISRGTMIPITTTNEVSNPIFGHSTWNTNWTDQASLVDEENTDEEFVLFGSSSAKVTATSTSDNSYYISVTCANTNTHAFSCFAKMPDGSSPSGLVNFYYTESLTETYTAVGDGWYRITATHAGVASPTGFYLTITNGYTVYIDGVQVEERAYASPLCYGDMLDCAWAGTAHASDTTRTAGRLRWNEEDIIKNVSQGTVRIVWLPHMADTNYPTGTNWRLFSTDAGFSIYRVQGTTDWRFTDGTNIADTANLSFSAFTPIVFYCTWSEATGIILYVNGSSAATSDFDVPTSNNYFYLGSGTTATSQIGGTFLDMTSWGRVLTATEILDDYTNISEHVTGGDGYGQRLNAIPWLWTDDGDDTLDNCYDSTHENWAVIGGVPGNVDADSIINFDTSDVNVDIDTIYFNQVVINNDEFVDPDEWSFFDLGDSQVDATACGGYVERVTLDSALLWGYDATVTAAGAKLINGKKIDTVFFRVKDSSSTTVNFKYSYLGDVNYYNSYESMATSTSFRIKKMDGFIIPDVGRFIPGVPSDGSASTGTLQVDAIRPSGSANLDMDYIYWAIDRLLTVENAADDKFFYYSSGTKSCIASGTALGSHSSGISHIAKLTGKLIEFSPNKLNIFINLMGGVDEPATFDDTIPYAMFVMPRWSIL